MNHLLRNFFIYISIVLLAVPAMAQDSSRSLENMVVMAVERLNAGDKESAESMLKAVLEKDDTNDAAWYYLYQVALADQEIDLAEAYLTKAKDLDPDNFWYRYRLAQIYSHTSRQELAIDMYEKLLEDFPKESDLYFDLVEFYASQKEYEKALDTIKEIENVIGMSEPIAVYRFNLLRIMEREEEAFESLREYNSKYSSPFVLSTLGDYEMSMYNDSTALAYYDEALDIAPDYSPALLGKAETYRVTRRYDEYFPVLYDYVEGKGAPVKAKADYLMAVLQRTDPKFLRTFRSQLDTVMNKTVQAHPKDSTALQTAAIYYYSTDRYPEAKVLFRENAQTHPESFGANADYVEFLMYAEYWKELSQAGREAFERFPTETAFLEMASVGDYNLDDYDKVLEVCEKVLEVAPADSSKTLRAWSTMGDAYHSLGESKKAYKAYDKALKINPDYVYVLNNYAYYLSEEGRKLKKAQAMSLKTIQAEPDNATYLDTYGWILFLRGKAAEAKPHFKHAMLYGGKDSPVILDHYAEVLYALGEYELAVVYWNMALQKNNDEIPGLEAKVKERKSAINK